MANSDTPVIPIHVQDLVFGVTKSAFKTSSLCLESCVLSQIAFCSFSYFTGTSNIWSRAFSTRYFTPQISSHMHNRWISSQVIQQPFSEFSLLTVSEFKRTYDLKYSREKYTHCTGNKRQLQNNLDKDADSKGGTLRQCNFE